MIRIGRFVSVCGMIIGAVAGTWLTSCNVYEPTPKANALIQLSFERSLENDGSAEVFANTNPSELKYKLGREGKALYLLGDGSSVEITSKRKLGSFSKLEVAFDFKRDAWHNPYKKGAGLQTIATLSGKGPERIEHLSFGFAPKKDLSLAVYFRDGQGNRHMLRTAPGLVTLDWHQVRLEVDAEIGETRLYVDAVLVGRTAAVSSLLRNGIDRVKLGTWHKKNQAYRGLVDNFVVLDRSI